MLFDLIEESKEIIGIDTSGEKGNRVLVERLAPHCRALGFLVHCQSPDNGQAVDLNLIAHSQAAASRVAPDLCPGGLALFTHLDTVPPGDPALWTETEGEPYRAVVKDGKIFGLGSADTKLDFLCKLLAIERVGLKNVKVPLALVGTFGEERALAGTRLIRESGILKPRWALVGEPSELKAVIAHKGIVYLRARFRAPSEAKGARSRREFRGRAAHGSMPHLGENAVEKALRWVAAQPDIEVVSIGGGTVHNVVPERCAVETSKSRAPSRRVSFLKKFLQAMDLARKHVKNAENPLFDPPWTTDNIGVIRMLGSETIEIEFDFRLIPETDGNELVAIFQAMEGLPGAEAEVVRSNPCMNTPRDSDIARRVKGAQEEIGLKPEFLAKSGNTEGAILGAMGVESVVIGPGRAAGNIHAPNEHNEVRQLQKAVDFYTAFLRQFC